MSSEPQPLKEIPSRCPVTSSDSSTSSSSPSSDSSSSSSSSSQSPSHSSFPSDDEQDTSPAPLQTYNTVVPIDMFNFNSKADREIILYQLWRDRFNLRECYVKLEPLDAGSIGKVKEALKKKRQANNRRSSRVKRPVTCQRDTSVSHRMSPVQGPRDEDDSSNEVNDYGARFKPSRLETKAAVELLEYLMAQTKAHAQAPDRI